MKINITKSSGGNVSCEGHCKNDFGDIRFVDIDNTTELDYWMEDYTSSSYAWFWIETPSDVETDQKILMYYNNSGASTTSNGTNTFGYFDHWTSDNTGDWATGEPTNNHYTWWENTKSFTEYRAFESNHTMQSWNSGTWDWTVIGWTADKSSDWRYINHVILRWSMRESDGADDSTIRVHIDVKNGSNTTNTAYTDVSIPSSSDYLSLRLTYLSDNVSYEWKNLSTGFILSSGSINNSSCIPPPDNASYFMHEQFDGGAGIFLWSSPTTLDFGNIPGNGGGEWYFDYWFIRKYADTEPSWSSFGSEVDGVKPNISFVSPTPPDNNQTTDTNAYAYINVSVNDPSNTSSFIDWDNSLVGYWNFDHTNSTHVFDNSTHSNIGSIGFLGNVSSEASISDTNATQCVDNDTLYWVDDFYNGWTFEATSGAAAGNSTKIIDYDYVNDSYRILYFQDELTGFSQLDYYNLYYDASGPGPTNGKFGSAFTFDGGNDRLTCPDDYSLDTPAVTVDFWVKPSKWDGNVVRKWGWGTEWTGYHIDVDADGSIRAIIAHDYRNSSSISTSINLNEWSHIVVTINNTVAKIYKNGIEKDSLNTTPLSLQMIGTAPVSIGGNSGMSGFYFNGTIDEVRVWNRALSWEEINASYNSTVNQLYHNFTGLSIKNYSYYAHAIDAAGNENTTETRHFEVKSNDTTKPNISFVPPTPPNNNQTTNTYAYINVSTTDTNNISSFIDWDNSLVGYWNFEHTNSTHVFDNSTYGNNGTFNGGLSTSDINAGKYGYALEFDGIDDYIDLPKDGMTAGRSEVTLEFWINADEWVSTNTIWDEYYSNIYWQNSIRCNYWYTRDSSTGSTGGRNNDLSLPTLTPGEWHHLVFVYSVSQNIKAIYLDGEFNTSTSTSIDTLTSERDAARIGYACDGDDFSGIIDEVRIWNRALSWEEINASYNSKVNQLYHNFTGLNEGNHTYYAHAIDAAGNENTTETRNFKVIGDPPEIEFVPPTPDNNTVTSNTYAYINVSVDDASDTSSFIDWDNSLVGYWNFEHTNSTHVFDNSTYNNNGTFNGANFGESNITNGKYGDALEFDGSNDYVDCGNDPSLNVTDEITIEAWVKTNTNATTQRVVSKQQTGVGIYNFKIVNQKFNIYIEDTTNSGYRYLSDNSWIGDGQWHHVVGTASIITDEIHMYLDGSLNDGSTDPISDVTSFSCTNNLRIGRRSDGSDYFNGAIDEVRVWNRTLSWEEINASYNSKVNQLYHNFTSPSEGNYTYYAHTIDTGGNENTTETRNLTVDTTKPNISFVQPTPPNNNQTTNTYAYINVSTTDTNNISSFIDWDNSLVGYWNFEHTDSTYIYDNSIYGNNGTFNGANFGESNITTGKYGKGLEFDGGDDYVGTTAVIPNEGTIEFWFNPNFDGDTTDQIVFMDARDSSRWWTVGAGGNFGGSQLTFSCEDGADVDYFAKFDMSSYVSSGNWYHVAGTWKIGEPLRLYVDADLKNSTSNLASFDIDDRENTLRMGYALDPSYSWPPVGYFNGTMDEVRMWSRALSWEEINASYNSTVNQLYHNFTGLSVGNYSYYAHAIDAAGNENTTETRHFEVKSNDTTKPNISFVSPTPDNNTAISDTYVCINVSTTDANNICSFIDWNQSLMGYWNFEHTNSTHVFDNSTYGNNGTFNGGLSTSDINAGNYGYALEFDGSDDYVEVVSSDLDITGDLTVEAWVYPETYNPVSSVDRRILINRIDGNNAYQITCWSGGGFIFAVNDGGTQYKNDSRGYSTHTWYHLLGTYDATSHEIILYVNGTVDSNGTSPARSLGNSGNLQIGRKSDDTGYFKGAIDEVRIWNRVLGWEEINASYNSKVNQLYHNFTGLSEGNYIYCAHVIDTTGNENTTEIRTLIIDATKPNISFVSPTPPDNNQTTNTYAYVNVSTTDTHDTSSFIDWNNSLVGYWNFDHYNATGIFDNSTYNNFGNFSGGIGTDNVTTGKYGKALDFDGDNDYVDCGNDDSLNPPQFTYEAWIWKATDTTAERAFFDHGAPRHFTVQGGTLYFETTSNGNVVGSTTIQPQTWYHAAITYNGTQATLYLNGEVDGTKVGTINPVSGNMRIGSCPCGGHHFNGTIDEVRIYNRALSPQEINASYNSKVNQLYHNFTDLSIGNYSYYAHAIDAAGNENTTETRHFEVLAENTSINVTPSEWNQGSVNIGDTNETTGFYFNLTNEGNVALDITINATNATNSTSDAGWRLNTTQGHDNFSLQYNKSGAGSWTPINITFDTFVTGLAVDSWQTFDLKLLMATTSSTVDPMNVTVTFKSVAS